MTMIEHRLPDRATWIQFFSAVNLPVLRHSVTELNRLHKTASHINNRSLAEVVWHDPLLALRVLTHVGSHRTQRQIVDITTIDQAIMMIGITPFFRAFEQLPAVEDHLKEHPKALLGVLKTIHRARRAAHWAHHWAALRRDFDTDEITLATLLHDLAELLMWLFAPTLALKVSEAQQAQPEQRSAIIQADIYGVSLYELKLALAKTWHLPALIIQLLDHNHAENPRVLNVKLAVDLARHSARDWTNPALPDDFSAIRSLLHINQETLVRHLDVDATTADLLLHHDKHESEVPRSAPSI